MKYTVYYQPFDDTKAAVPLSDWETKQKAIKEMEKLESDPAAYAELNDKHAKGNFIVK